MTTPNFGAANAGAVPGHPFLYQQPVVAAHNLSHRHGAGEATVTALDSVNIGFGAGRFAAVMGASGSGKSTLLHLLAGLDRASSGTIVLDGSDLGSLDDRGLTRLRRDKVGFVFQSFNLLPVLDAEENILLPLSLAHDAGDLAGSDWHDRSRKYPAPTREDGGHVRVADGRPGPRNARVRPGCGLQSDH